MTAVRRQSTSGEDKAANSRQPAVLLISTMPWMFPARVADAFRRLGFRTEAVCHPGHPLRCLSKPVVAHRLGWLAETSSIENAIARAEVDVLVPCDDPAVMALHVLHRRSAKAGVRALIERSLGDPAHFHITAKRSALIGLAQSMGLLVPRSETIANRGDLLQAAARIGYPCVLKRDLTWSGMGTTPVSGASELPRAWSRTMGWMAGLRAGKAVVRDRRPRGLIDRLTKTAAVEVQEFIDGTPANRAVFCRSGKVIAGLSVEALRTGYAGGPASVVRVVHHRDMTGAVDALVGRLGLSGFCGFDFVISRSGRAYLIELNPRATPVSHLPLVDGTHLPSALYRQITGRQPSSMVSPIPGDLIALFPTEWKRDKESPFLHEAYHDLPRDEPALLAWVGLTKPASSWEKMRRMALQRRPV
jgi:hypothetical protein